jgi:hypothetical protein
MRVGRLLLAGFIALSWSCASTPASRMAQWRERAVSERTFERVRPFLEELAPGDDLSIFKAASEVHVQRRRRRGGPPRPPVVVIPSWISSLSGGAAGGLSMFGQLVGRSDDVVYGSHIFGVVAKGHIVPRHQVLTTATLVSPEEFEKLVADRFPGIGRLPRPGGTLFFRDLYVAGARELAFPAPTEDAPAAPAASSDGLAAFYSEDSYRKLEPVLDGLPQGTDLFSLLRALGATFVTVDYGETHSLLAPGFLNYKRVRTRTIEGAEGVFKLRPFGWVAGDREVVDRIAIFENDRLQRVVRHDGREDWTGYLVVPSPDAAPAD